MMVPQEWVEDSAYFLSEMKTTLSRFMFSVVIEL